MGAAIIETDRLTKRYGTARGIDDLSLAVAPGEVFGFLGPNGAGKTTTIRTLLDLLHPTSGSACLFGLDSRRDSRAIHARLGNLPGEFSYDDRLTGRDALRFFAALRGVPDLRRAEALADRFQADLSRRMGELSRGNRQKVGLVQALFHEPELVILDEPTAGLDPLMQEEFLAVVAEERERGATVFLSSHDLDEVQRACDRVAIIRDGRLIAVEDVASMRERAHRDVAVRFGRAVDPHELAAVPGVVDVRADGDRVRFHVAGELDPVVKALARHDVRDLEVTRPTLEELFLTYYRDGGAR
ncbi:MAG TPA: ABC transporter ATP-binding protein [Baekduia sp.]|nr:ABC transporter ATP-binding protein [Baekduia sp.]